MNDFLSACKRGKVKRTPIWIMRQAGRYLPQYRKLRTKYGIFEICKKPELCAEVTLMPIEEFGFDAAIMFADIMLPLEGIGVNVEIMEERGPHIEHPIKALRDVERLKEFDTDSVGFVMDSVKLVRKNLTKRTALIGFSGAPFTLASYLIEGGPSRSFSKTKELMYSKPEVWQELMRKLTDMVENYLEAQIRAGTEAIQLFDSWVGCLSPSDYEKYVLPYSKRIFKKLEGKAPLIHFGTQTSSLLRLMKEAGGDIMGIDWRIDLMKAWRELGNDIAIQGNLDPAVLLGKPDFVVENTKELLAKVDGKKGHIFNLGHGILPDTPVENVRRLVDTVHDYRGAI